MTAKLLVGNWKLLSWQVVTEDGAKELFGSKPNGYLILTAGGRMMAITTAEGRSTTCWTKTCNTALGRPWHDEGYKEPK